MSASQPFVRFTCYKCHTWLRVVPRDPNSPKVSVQVDCPKCGAPLMVEVPRSAIGSSEIYKSLHPDTKAPKGTAQ